MKPLSVDTNSVENCQSMCNKCFMLQHISTYLFAFKGIRDGDLKWSAFSNPQSMSGTFPHVFYVLHWSLENTSISLYMYNDNYSLCYLHRRFSMVLVLSVICTCFIWFYYC